MIKDLYPISKYPLEELLRKNNYKLNEETYKIFIHDKYCIHITKNGEPCIRRKLEGKDFCGKHSPSDVSFTNKCIYNKCKKITKKNPICCIHLKYLNRIINTPLPCVDEEEKRFFGHNIYHCKIYNKNIKIIIKDYVHDGCFSSNKENKLINHNSFSFSMFLYNIYNNYRKFVLNILNKYNINIDFLYNFLKVIHDEFNKNDKKVSVLSNSTGNISKKKGKKKKNKKIIESDSSTNEIKESQNITISSKPDIKKILKDNVDRKGNVLSKYSTFILYLFSRLTMDTTNNYMQFKLFEELYSNICKEKQITDVYDGIEFNKKEFENILEKTIKRYNERYIHMYDAELPIGIKALREPLSKKYKRIVINLVLFLKYSKDYILNGIDNTEKINDLLNKYV